MFDDSQSPQSGTETRHRHRNDATEGEAAPSATRRSWLKLAGSAAAVAATGVTPAAGASYDTITVPAGTRETFHVGSGEVWENKLIDITADGASVQIYPEGNDWTVRNIGIRGVHPGGHYVFTPYVADHDSTGVIENVYAGDGQVEGTGKGFCWVQYDHRGTIEFRNVNVQQFVDNGLYTTSPGDEQDHTHGRSHIYDSYFRSNNISNCRTGAQEGTHGHTCEVHGNTIVVDSTVPPCDVGCSSPGAQNSRAVWAVNGGVEVKDCDVQVDTDYGGYFGTLHGGYYTNDPWADNRTGADADTSVPDCVPTSATAAADGQDCDSGGGGGGGGGGGDGDHLEVVAVDNGPLFSYEFTVKGSASLDTDNGDNSAESGNDAVTDDGDGTVTVSGEVGNGYGDSFYVDGTVLDWSADTDAANYDLYVDGTAVSTDDLVADVFEVVAADGGPLFSYSFDVDGDVALNTSNGDNSAESGNDAVTDNGDGTFTVSGEVGNGYGDSFYVAGSLSDWSADTDASNYTLYRDGTEVPPSDVGGGDGGDGGGDPGTVVDDFEDGDLAEYSFDRGASGASVVSSPTYSGSNALEYAGTSTEAISTSGLDAYPSAGDTVSFRVRGSGGADMLNLSYGVQDHTNRYFVRVNFVEDNLALYRYEGGTSYELAADWSTPALSQDAWYEVEIAWGTGGGHAVTLYDASGSEVAGISGSDATWTSGGVGYDAYLSSGQRIYFDDVRIL